MGCTGKSAGRIVVLSSRLPQRRCVENKNGRKGSSETVGQSAASYGTPSPCTHFAPTPMVMIGDTKRGACFAGKIPPPPIAKALNWVTFPRGTMEQSTRMFCNGWGSNAHRCVSFFPVTCECSLVIRERFFVKSKDF